MRTLVADDDPIATAILTHALASCGVDVTVVHDGVAAWQLLNGVQPPSIAIVDWMMPGLDGIDLCNRVRSTPRLSGTYIILLTGRDSRADLVAALDAGADDYMVKPVDVEELRARMGVALRVATLQQNLTDTVKKLQNARDHLAHLASTDGLTGVYSRREWFHRGATEFARGRRYERTFSLLMLDLDWFKQINDTFGHDVGDRVLQQVGTMLLHQCRQSDIVGRLGGEEFAVLLPETSADAARTLASRLTEACRSLVMTDASSNELRCSCSIGVAELRPEDQELEAVMKRADGALYEAKRAGRNRWTFAA
jgi:two-component system chemotaxis response regulator CheY